MKEHQHPYQNMFLEDLEGEQWKEILGFEGYLLVSNKGRIKALERTIVRKRNGTVYIPEKIVKQQVLERVRLQP